MKAMTYGRYGPPEVLACEDVSQPGIKDDELLVQVEASSLNYGDVALLKGSPFVVRFSSGIRKPKHRILGGDLAGRVVMVGDSVDQFKIGDEVFGDIGSHGFGAYAEYAVAPQKALALKPDNCSFPEAAAVPQAAVVALQGLRDAGQLKAGQAVLVNGASGGIGPFAVQIAKAFGAEVTGVCSSRNLDLVRSLGADHVIDYAREEFTEGGEQYDLIFDIVANRSVSNYARALKPEGTYVACAFNGTALILGPLISRRGKKVIALIHKPNQADLYAMKELLESGQVRPVIDSCYPLQELDDAVRHFETGNTRGKVIITV
ncbi:MAG: NAD(P)-dependent alcohol dehydrogenase [Candidatus Promineifilaceae bacterium]